MTETLVEEMPTPAPISWREILTKAAEYLRNHGWKQHDYGDARGEPVCANGALRLGAGMGRPVPEFSVAIPPELNKAMRAFVFAGTPEPSSDVINSMRDYDLIERICTINNLPEQNVEGITAMMDKAAQDADPDEAPTRADQPAAA